MATAHRRPRRSARRYQRRRVNATRAAAGAVRKLMAVAALPLRLLIRHAAL